MSILAIDIGGTKFTVGLFERRDAAWQMVARVSRSTDRTGGPRWMTSQIAEVVGALAPTAPIECIGVGFGGPVDFPTQKVVLSTHVEGWQDFDLVEWLRGEFRLPVVMDNDANVGALGEGFHGAGRGARPLFYMTLSTGIGGGILTESGLLRGADSYGGEVGHMTVRPGGPECLCGEYGCLERMCCGLWLERDYGKPVPELLTDAAFVERYVVDLALGLKSVTMLLNPARIVIGGGMSKAGDALFVPLRAELRRRITAWSRARIDIVPATLGDDSVLWGALVLALERQGERIH